MKVISCFDEIADGAIGSVTYKVEDNGSKIQEATVEIVDEGCKAVLRTNKFFVSDAGKIQDSFDAILEVLKLHNISEVLVHGKDGTLHPLIKR